MKQHCSGSFAACNQPIGEVVKSVGEIEQKPGIAGTIGMRRSVNGGENPSVG
jgi:hypothetical protein